MKKILIFLIIFMSISSHALAGDNIAVYLDGEELTFAQPPVIRNDSTLVPFRVIFEKLGMTVQWSEEERRVTARKKDLLITLFADNLVMTVNNEKITLLTPPVIINDYTLVPLRAVSEAAGADVAWDADTRTVTINTEPDEYAFDDWCARVLDLTNAARRERGIAPLEWDDTLAALAGAHCADMIDRGYFDHNTPDGKTPFDRMKEAGIKYTRAGENIAAGQYSPEEAMVSWMKSEGHRANILNPNFTKIGISFAKGGDYGIYWAQEFICPAG